MTDVGDMVHVVVDPDRNDGQDFADARVVRVDPGPDGRQIVNARVLYSDGSREWATGFPLYDTHQELVAAWAALHPDDPDAGRPAGAFIGFGEDSGA